MRYPVSRREGVLPTVPSTFRSENSHCLPPQGVGNRSRSDMHRCKRALDFGEQRSRRRQPEDAHRLQQVAGLRLKGLRCR